MCSYTTINAAVKTTTTTHHLDTNQNAGLKCCGLYNNKVADNDNDTYNKSNTSVSCTASRTSERKRKYLNTVLYSISLSLGCHHRTSLHNSTRLSKNVLK